MHSSEQNSSNCRRARAIVENFLYSHLARKDAATAMNLVYDMLDAEWQEEKEILARTERLLQGYSRANKEADGYFDILMAIRDTSVKLGFFKSLKAHFGTVRRFVEEQQAPLPSIEEIKVGIDRRCEDMLQTDG